jgi:hypothetical protein
MGFPAGLRWFQAGEFRWPDQMDPEFVRWLDAVRGAAGVPMVITDDYRQPQDAPPGTSPSSLHYVGLAVDVRTRTWTPSEYWRVLAAVIAAAERAPGRITAELVHGPSDRHLHLDCLPGGGSAHRLVLAHD